VRIIILREDLRMVKEAPLKRGQQSTPLPIVSSLLTVFFCLSLSLQQTLLLVTGLHLRLSVEDFSLVKFSKTAKENGPLKREEF
jgi:hypothetical protein